MSVGPPIALAFAAVAFATGWLANWAAHHEQILYAIQQYDEPSRERLLRWYEDRTAHSPTEYFYAGSLMVLSVVYWFPSLVIFLTTISGTSAELTPGGGVALASDGRMIATLVLLLVNFVALCHFFVVYEARTNDSFRKMLYERLSCGFVGWSTEMWLERISKDNKFV